MSTSARLCLKCGSRDHESGKCPKNQEHRRHVAQAVNFTAWCFGSDDVHSTTAEAFGCENLARDRVSLDCGATDTVGREEPIEAITDKSQEAFGAVHDWACVDTNDRSMYKFGDARRKQALSQVRVKAQPGRHVAHLHVHAQETEGVPVLFSARSLSALGAVINFETCQAVLRNLEPETLVLLERSPTGHLSMDLFEQMPVVSDNPCRCLESCSWTQKLLGRREIQKRKCLLLVLIPNTHLFPDRRTRLTLLTLRQCDDREFSLRNQYHLSHSSISRNLSLRRPGMTSVRIAHMSRDEVMDRLKQLGTSCKCGVHSSRKEEYLAQTRGEDDEVRDERQCECLP